MSKNNITSLTSLLTKAQLVEAQNSFDQNLDNRKSWWKGCINKILKKKPDATNETIFEVTPDQFETENKPERIEYLKSIGVRMEQYRLKRLEDSLHYLFDTSFPSIGDKGGVTLMHPEISGFVANVNTTKGTLDLSREFLDDEVLTENNTYTYEDVKGVVHKAMIRYFIPVTSLFQGKKETSDKIKQLEVRILDVPYYHGTVGYFALNSNITH